MLTSAEQKKESELIGWSIRILTRFLPWDTKCLAQAIGGSWMLQRRNLPSTLYLGVNNNHSKEKWLEAHAWLRCGNEFVTGESRFERFKVLVKFTEK